MIVNALVPAGTFGTGSDRDSAADWTIRELEELRDGRTFVWYYGSQLEVVAVGSPEHRGGIPTYRVIGRITTPTSRWFIVDVYSDARMEYRVAAETVEADASDQAIRDVHNRYPKAGALVATPIGGGKKHPHIKVGDEDRLAMHVASCERCQREELAGAMCSEGLALFAKTLGGKK